MISSIVSRLVILVFGTLYPAYASYKAVRTKNVKEYVKWMMYWIVFALFTCAETFTDVFFSFWFPFYYEIKIILVLWLLSPATKGSSILYRRFVHPALSRREAEIDEALARATEQGYTAVLHLGTKGVNYATTVLMQTAIKNFPNVVPSTLNVLPGSQSDPALSSSGNRKAESPPRDQSSGKDSHDGVETSRRSTTPKRRVKLVDVTFDALEHDLQDITTDDNSDSEFQEMDIDEQPTFKKSPKQTEKTRKTRRGDHADATRKQRSRACKELPKTYEVEFSDEGGGGLVQQLRKSYSLSDLTGEKEDENRNTSDTPDETDMQVEPRRREHVGRRGYSPRRTQSSSNRVEMYFSEVDVDVRQPRPREPIASLTNIRSSDDISSGYSSGEALQTHRASQGETLVRTSSVGARIRTKARSTTKKTPEGAEEDSGSVGNSPLETLTVPSSLSFLTPQQVYELLLFFSQSNTSTDRIDFDPNHFNDIKVTNNEAKLQSGKNESEEIDFVDLAIDEAIPTLNNFSIEKIIQETTPRDANNWNEKNSGPLETNNESSKMQIISITKNKTGINEMAGDISQKSNNTEIDVQKITNEICQEKFDELKHLLDHAHKAVTNIVSSKEKLDKSNEASTKVTPEICLHDMYTNEITNDGSKRTFGSLDDTSSVEMWTASNIERSNSDCNVRAGKYNKKPAPKAPSTSKSDEDSEETESQNALKATLVIKTGMVKTFSNVDTTKDVFLRNVPDLRKSKKKKSKFHAKEGFSKLLTIPKNIFHGTFHKDKVISKDDDSVSNASEGNSSSRSGSIGSPEMIMEIDTKISDPTDEINNETSLLFNKRDINETEIATSDHSKSPSYQSLASENIQEKDIIEDITKQNETQCQDDHSNATETEIRSDVAETKPKLKIPQLSRSPQQARRNISYV